MNEKYKIKYIIHISREEKKINKYEDPKKDNFLFIISQSIIIVLLVIYINFVHYIYLL